MEINKIKYLILTIILILTICIQSIISNFLQYVSIVPNLLLIIVVVLGFINKNRTALIIGLIAGLLLDISSGSYLGLFTLTYMYIGYISSRFNRIFVKDNLTIMIILVSVSDIFYHMIVYTFSFLVRQRFDIPSYLVFIILPEILITIIFSVILYKPLIIFNKLCKFNR